MNLTDVQNIKSQPEEGLENAGTTYDAAFHLPLPGSGLIENLRWFRLTFSLVLIIRLLLILLFEAGHDELTNYLLFLAAAISFIPRFQIKAMTVMVGLLIFQFFRDLPVCANHIYLELILLVFMLLLNEERGKEEAGLLFQSLLLITVIIMVASGTQKLFYGRYLDGQFLAWVISTDDRFADFFKYFIPAAEFERLRSLKMEVGSGPYRVDSTMFVVMANVVVWAEILLPVLLLFRKTMVLGAIGLIVMIIGIELGAREATFGCYVMALLTLMLPGPQMKRLFICFAVLITLYVLCVLTGVPIVRIMA